MLASHASKGDRTLSTTSAGCLGGDSGNVGGFWQECAQKANGAKLNGVSQPIVSTAVRSDLGSIMIVQEEVPG